MLLEHRVVKVSLTSDNHTVTIVAGTGFLGSKLNELNLPFGIFVDINFNLYVVDAQNYRIQLFRPGKLNETTVTGNNIPNTLTLKYPTDVILDGDDFLYIVDNQHHRIIRVGNAEFQCIIGCIEKSRCASNAFHHVYSFRSDSSRNLYVADESNRRIQKFSISVNSCGKSLNRL